MAEKNTAETQSTQRLSVFLFSVERTENKKKRIIKIVVSNTYCIDFRQLSLLNCRLSRQFKKIDFFASFATLR